jgi:hypothetical protein
MADKKLKPEVAAQFELAPDAPIHGGFLGFGAIDLSELNLEQAQSLVQNGFNYLIPKQVKKEKNS